MLRSAWRFNAVCTLDANSKAFAPPLYDGLDVPHSVHYLCTANSMRPTQADVNAKGIPSVNEAALTVFRVLYQYLVGENARTQGEISFSDACELHKQQAAYLKAASAGRADDDGPVAAK